MAKRKSTLPPARPAKRPALRSNEFPVISPTPAEVRSPSDEVTVPRASRAAIEEARLASRGAAQRAPSSGVPAERLSLSDEVTVPRASRAAIEEAARSASRGVAQRAPSSGVPDKTVPALTWDQVTVPRGWVAAVEEARPASGGVAQGAPSSGAAEPDSLDEPIIVGEEIETEPPPEHSSAPAVSVAPRQPTLPRAAPSASRPPAPARHAQATAPVAPSRARAPAPAIDAPEPPTSPTLPPAPTNQHTSNPNTFIGRVFPDKIYRFRLSERMLHWSIAVPFLVCVATAAVLFLVYNRHPQIPFRPAFSWTHRISGAALIALPLLAILFNIRDIKIHLSNIREGWSWRLDDVKWLALTPFAILSKRVKLPDAGKFNAGEKLNFMASMGSYTVMGATGVLLWLTPVALGVWFVHLAVAVAVLPLVGGHLFMAVINPSSRVGLSGMFNGWVDREWASHHYTRWYRQIIARHMQYHGHVPELDTTEHDELKADESALLHRGARARRLVSGVSIGLAVAMALGATGYAMRDRLFESAGVSLYLAEAQLLRSRPAADAPAVAGEPLERGAQVLRLATSGDFALVQDATARAGYVPKEALVRSAPPAAAASDPPACAETAEQAEPEQCEACAGARRDACVEACPESRKEVCSQICEERYAAAVEACKPEALPPEPLTPQE